MTAIILYFLGGIMMMRISHMLGPHQPGYAHLITTAIWPLLVGAATLHLIFKVITGKVDA